MAQTRTTTLFQDAERLRENLKALANRREEQDLRRRYLDQLSKQENDIDQLRARTEEVKKQLEAAQARLSELITTLSWKD